jgi:hypothetical protein
VLRWCDRDDLTVAISALGRHRSELNCMRALCDDPAAAVSEIGIVTD